VKDFVRVANNFNRSTCPKLTETCFDYLCKIEQCIIYVNGGDVEEKRFSLNKKMD